MTFSGSSLFSSFDCDEGVDSSTCSALAQLGLSWLLRLHSAAQGGSRGGASAVDAVSGAAADGSSAFERTALGLNADASFLGKK